jgi:hypothetical protein
MGPTLLRSFPATRLIAVLGLLAATAAPACKTNEIDIPVGTGASQVVSMMIGSQGGTLTVTDPSSPAFGTEIEVPPDAVPTNTVLSVRPAARPPAGPLGLRPTGPVVLVRFTKVTKDVIVRLPFRLDLVSGEQPTISRYGEDETSWSSAIATTLPDGTRRLQITTRDFGWFFTGGESAGEGGGTDGGTLLDASTTVDTPPADQVPPTFAGLGSAQVVGQGQALLTWEAGSDDRTAPENLRYRLYLPSFAVLGAPQGDTPPGATQLMLNVQPGVAYYFLVRAVDEAGNEDSNLKVITLRVPRVFDGGPDLPPDGSPDGSDAGPDAPDIGPDVAPTCTDNIQNGGEQGVDCGGPCPLACPVGANDLSNIGLADFTISFTVQTTATVQSALVDQRRDCGGLTPGDSFWDCRMFPDGTVTITVADGTNRDDLQNSIPVNDGNPHQVSINRNGGIVALAVDGMIVGSASTMDTGVSLGPLVPLQIGTDVCDFQDATQPLAGTLTNVAVTSP